jgi:hypothetical protein
MSKFSDADFYGHRNMDEAIAAADNRMVNLTNLMSKGNCQSGRNSSTQSGQ